MSFRTITVSQAQIDRAFSEEFYGRIWAGNPVQAWNDESRYWGLRQYSRLPTNTFKLSLALIDILKQEGQIAAYESAANIQLGIHHVKFPRVARNVNFSDIVDLYKVDFSGTDLSFGVPTKPDCLIHECLPSGIITDDLQGMMNRIQRTSNQSRLFGSREAQEMVTAINSEGKANSATIAGASEASQRKKALGVRPTIHKPYSTASNGKTLGNIMRFFPIIQGGAKTSQTPSQIKAPSNMSYVAS